MSRMTQRHTDGWGKPTGSTFRKRHTLLVAVGDHRLRVHRHLAPIVDHALTLLDQTDLVVDSLLGLDAYPDGRGLLLRLSPPNPELVAQALAGHGFDPDPDLADGYRYRETIDVAMATGEALDAARDRATDGEGILVASLAESAADGQGAPEERIERDDERWDHGLPGHREIEPGDIGSDVLFLQAYLDAPRTGILDAATLAAVNAWQERRGLPIEQRVSERDWQNITPHYRRLLSPGDGGRAVRIISAALIAGGHVERDSPVRAIFGVALAKEIRAFQEHAGLMRNGRIRSGEWAGLLAPWR